MGEDNGDQERLLFAGGTEGRGPVLGQVAHPQIAAVGPVAGAAGLRVARP